MLVQLKNKQHTSYYCVSFTFKYNLKCALSLISIRSNDYSITIVTFKRILKLFKDNLLKLIGLYRYLFFTV